MVMISGVFACVYRGFDMRTKSLELALILQFNWDTILGGVFGLFGIW